MALNVTKADQVIEVKNICLTIYSQPGLGKTSLAFTASKPLLLDFDKGAYRAVERQDVVEVEKWSDVANIKAEDIADYDTIIIDTVGKALDALSADIIKQHARFSYGGALSQQGWGQLGIKFSSFLKLLRSFGKDVVLIAHMDEKHDGDSLKERMQISGGSKNLVLTDSDAIARISITNRQRQLVFTPTEASFGKDPAGIEAVNVPQAPSQEFSTFLGDTIAQIKSGLNALSEAQVARRSEVEWFENTLVDVTTPEQINELLGRAKKAGKDVAKMVVDHAAERGFDFDPTTKTYTWPGEPNPDHQEKPMIDKPEDEAA